MSIAKTFLFAGGGTGGHLFPGIAVAQELRRRDASIHVVFVGSTRAIESTIFADQGLEHRTIPVEPLPTLKRNPFRFVSGNWRALRAAAKVLNELQPVAVIGLGGFASAPLVWAASRRRIPVVLLEQNVIAGRTTRWLSRFADCVCVSFAEMQSQLTRAKRIVATGNPVREQIAALHGNGLGEMANTNPLTPQSRGERARRSLLILGGSQGADTLNDAVIGALRQLRGAIDGWDFVHQTGPRQQDSVRQLYEQLGLQAVVEPFFHDMPERYSRASLAISRAGATTLAELACAGIPMILLPYPQAADNHQQANAQLFSDRNAAVVVNHTADPEGTVNELALVLKRLVDDANQRQLMSIAARSLAVPDAAKRIADVLVEMIE